MRIVADETAAVIVDVQERLFPHMYKREPLQKSIVTLIHGLQVLEIPILVTQQYTKGLGPTLKPVHEALGEYTPIEKIAFSCMDEEKFSAQLAKLYKKRVILAGIETHVCVMQTAIDMLQQGYIPVVVEDCVSSRKLEDTKTAISRLRVEGAVITSYESILFELLRYAGTDTFRAISKLVK